MFQGSASLDVGAFMCLVFFSFFSLLIHFAHLGLGFSWLLGLLHFRKFLSPPTHPSRLTRFRKLMQLLADWASVDAQSWESIFPNVVVRLGYWTCVSKTVYVPLHRATLMQACHDIGFLRLGWHAHRARVQ